MKRYLVPPILLLSLSMLLIFLGCSQNLYHYTQLMIPKTEYEQIQIERERTDRNLLSSLIFNEYPLFYDELTSRWFYSIDPNKPNTDPAIKIISAADPVKIAFADEIVPGKTISMLAFTDSVVKEYSLSVTTLPLIRIGCENDYLTGIDLSAIYPIQFTLFDNRSESLYPLVKSDGTLHMRGEISRFFDKKNFRISLTEKTAGKETIENQIPLLDLRKDGDWILYSAYNDQEKIRNVFSSNLWMESCAEDNEFGLKNGMEYRYAELFWNNQYCGLYALGYPIDAKQMGVQPDAMGHYDEFVFKQKHWGPKTDGPDPNYDGLILQHEADQSDVNNGIALTKMYFAMLESGAVNGLWNNDEKNLLDVWLYIKLMQGSGQVNHEFPGKLRNMYLTIKKSNTGTKILYTPWDMDMSWGNQTNTYNPAYLNFTCQYCLDVSDNSYEMTVNPISVLLESDPMISKLLKERYSELRADVWSEEAIDAMLDSLEQDIYNSGAFLRDMERWPNGGYQDPDLRLSLFKEYVHGRLEFMDQYIDSLGSQLTNNRPEKLE